MDGEDRLWKFRKPQWMNSVAVRNAGVYSAGGLVRPLPGLLLALPEARARLRPADS